MLSLEIEFYMHPWIMLFGTQFHVLKFWKRIWSQLSLAWWIREILNIRLEVGFVFMFLKEFMCFRTCHAKVFGIELVCWNSNCVLEIPEFDCIAQANKLSLKRSSHASNSFANIYSWLERPPFILHFGLSDHRA